MLERADTAEAIGLNSRASALLDQYQLLPAGQGRRRGDAEAHGGKELGGQPFGQVEDHESIGAEFAGELDLAGELFRAGQFVRADAGVAGDLAVENLTISLSPLLARNRSPAPGDELGDKLLGRQRARLVTCVCQGREVGIFREQVVRLRCDGAVGEDVVVGVHRDDAKLE